MSPEIRKKDITEIADLVSFNFPYYTYYACKQIAMEMIDKHGSASAVIEQMELPEVYS